MKLLYQPVSSAVNHLTVQILAVLFFVFFFSSFFFFYSYLIKRISGHLKIDKCPYEAQSAGL